MGLHCQHWLLLAVRKGVAFPLTLEYEGNCRLCGHSWEEKKVFLQTNVLLYNHECSIIFSFLFHWLWPMWLAGKATSGKEKSPHFFPEVGVQRNPAFLTWIDKNIKLSQTTPTYLESVVTKCIPGPCESLLGWAQGHSIQTCSLTLHEDAHPGAGGGWIPLCLPLAKPSTQTRGCIIPKEVATLILNLPTKGTLWQSTER